MFGGLRACEMLYKFRVTNPWLIGSCCGGHLGDTAMLECAVIALESVLYLWLVVLPSLQLYHTSAGSLQCSVAVLALSGSGKSSIDYGVEKEYWVSLH